MNKEILQLDTEKRISIHIENGNGNKKTDQLDLKYLLNPANIKIQDNLNYLEFNYKNKQHNYYKNDNIITCESNSGIKKLNENELKILNYHLKCDIFLFKSLELKENLDKCDIEKTIIKEYLINYKSKKNFNFKINNELIFKKKELNEIMNE
ncbi:unnamed protein product [Didymodactylos carnosus]|uniref:Uncharacterized protein n=1 Tax=Didymodactylos carnosus TaxID=1234261 RepID=A0A815JPM1_9BILA|nr:unnamed protein product [Didymodactylos carnosus]CAF4277504.1 unnamed protein product [Didymodactylos carnosus]